MTPEERKARKRVYDKARYEANKEAILDRKKAYYEANKEAILAANKAYYEANKGAELRRHKSYYEANKEAIAERKKGYQKAYREANREKGAEYVAKRRARKRDGIPDFLRGCPDEKRRLVDIYKMRKLFTEITGVEHHVDHMWPLSKGGPHWSGNLQIIPAQENLSKKDRVCRKTKATIKEALKWAEENYCDTTDDQGGTAALERT